MAAHDMMTRGSARPRSWSGGLRRGLIALSLIALGVAGATLVLESSRRRMPMPASVSSTHRPIEKPVITAGAAVEPTDEVEVVLLPEAVAQAGIKTAEVTVVEPRISVQVPGTVLANAYREVKVFPIVGGIVTKVHVELGTAVKREAPLATLLSAVLAEAQTKYLSAKAMVEADHQKLERTKQLVEIGAASRQEFEEVSAVHASHATEAEAARQRLLLLGLTRKQVEALRRPSQIVSDVVVPAPIGGLITSRSANAGQVVAMDEEGTFIQRTVTLGPLAGESYLVLQGLEPGAVVVTEGSFFLRAENLRTAPAS